jgi:hypothetical protein
MVEPTSPGIRPYLIYGGVPAPPGRMLHIGAPHPALWPMAPLPVFNLPSCI